MLNLLIANKSLQKLQSLQNYISQYIPEIRVGYITTDGKEVLERLNQQHYDIILLDNNLPSCDGYDILQKLSNIKKIEYQNSFIFLTSNESAIKSLKKHDLVYDAFLDTDSINKIIHTLEKIADTQKIKSSVSYMKCKIINELQEIGFNLAHKGTHYLVESVLLIAKFDYNGENLSQNIYPKVSEIYKRSLNNVKCNITSATEAACKNISPETFSEYFRFSSKIKPTTKMIIYSVLQRL